MYQQNHRGSRRPIAGYALCAAILAILTICIFQLPALAQTITINSVQSHTNTPALVGGSGTALTPCNAPTVTVNFDFSGFTAESHTVALQIGTTPQSVTNVSGASGTGITRNFTASICTETEGLLDFDVTLSDTTFGDITQTATNSVELDVTAPAAPTTPDMSAASDSGSSNSDNITNDTTPTFTGTAEADSTVTLTSSLNGNVGTGTATGGNYSITASALTGSIAGTAHSMTATAQDAAGNVSTASGGLNISVDTGVNAPSTPDMSAATDSGSSNSDNITNDQTPIFTGTAEADSTVSITSSVNGSVGSGTATGGNYSITTSTLDGSFAGTSHTLTAAAVDVAGNSSIASGGLNATIDTGVNTPSTPNMTAGSDSGSSSTDNITNDQTPTFTGTADADSTVTLSSSVNGNVGSTTATGGNYSITASTLDGSFAGTAHNMTASAVDVAGNSSAASGTLSATIDTGVNAPSTPDMTAGTDSGSSATDDITNDQTPTFTGAAEADSTVTLTSSVNGNVGSGTATGGNYSITASTLNGSFAGTSHDMTASAVDVAGNSSAASGALSATIDTGVNAPSTPNLIAASDTGSSNTDNITFDVTPTVDGTAEANSTVTITSSVNGNVGSGTATGGNYSITTSTLDASTLGTAHNLSASAVDVAGNSSGNSGSLSVTMDNAVNAPSTPDMTAGTDSGTFNNDNLTNDQTPTFTGTAEINSTVTLTSSVNGAVGTGTATGGNWSITASTLDGSTLGTAHDITASAVDVAGNSSAASGALNATIDIFVDPPTAPDLESGSDSGILDIDDITNIQTPTFSGFAEDDSVVTLFSSLHGTARGTGTATGGIWTIISSNLTGGVASVHSMTATAVDLAGNSSATSAPLQVTIDTIAPAGFSETITGPTFTGSGIVYVTSTANSQLAATDISVDATDSGGSGTGIDSCQIQFDGGGFNSYAIVSGGALNGVAFNMPSPDGPHTYDVNCTDVAGNTSSDFSRTRTVDDTAPNIDNPRHQNTTCYPTNLCNANQDIVVNTYVKALTQASVTAAYPTVTASTFDYPSFNDPVAGVNPGSGLDACALTGTQSDTPSYAAGSNFMIAIGDGVKNFSLSCDDNIGNNAVNDSPDLQVDDTAPTIPNNFSHDNTTCYPFASCITGSEIVSGGTFVKAQDKQPFFPTNPYLPDYPQFIPRSTFQWEQSDAGGTIDDVVSGGVMSGLRDCVLTGGTTEDDTIVSPPFSNVFSLMAIDGAYTVRDNCRDNLGNQAFTDAATITVDDTAPGADFATTGPRYDDPADGVIFIESRTQITPILADGGVGVDLGGIGGAPADVGPTNPACEQNVDERINQLLPCQSTFSFNPPDEDHHLWIMRPDLLGNVAESHFVFIVDDTYPVINLERPFEGDTFLLNSLVTAQWEVNDAGLTFFDDVEDAPFAPGLNKRGSGIRSVTATTPSGAPIDTDDIAVHSYTITVTDNLGHTTALTISYRTVLDFRIDQGFRNRIDNDGGFRLGDLLEFRFSLTDVDGIEYSGVSPVITLFGPDDEPVDIGDDRRADYDEELGLYLFPIDTANLSPGRYKILVEVGDGEFHEFEFDLIE